MTRGVATATVAVVVLATALVVAGFAIDPAAASPEPGPFCDVCGEAFDSNVTATHATLQLTADGDVEWRVENQVDPETADAYRDNPEVLERRARKALDDHSQVPANPTDVSVRVGEDTLIVSFVDRGAVRKRLGLLVLPYFHDEGYDYWRNINADEIVVTVPEGYRIVNDPAGAEVADDRVIWTGSTGYENWEGSGHDDAYVVAGRGASAELRGRLLIPLLPLDPFMYGLYVVGAVYVAGLAFSIYSLQGHRLGPRPVSAGVALTTVPFIVAVVAAPPVALDTFGGAFFLLFGLVFSTLLGLVGGVVMYVAATLADPVGGGS